MKAGESMRRNFAQILKDAKIDNFHRQKEIHIEYYRRGELVRSYSNHFVG